MGCCFSEPTIEPPVNIHTYPQPQPQLYGIPANIPISQIHANGNGYGYVYGNIYGSAHNNTLPYQPPFQAIHPEIPQPTQYYQGQQLLYPQSVYQPYQSTHLHAPSPSAPLPSAPPPVSSSLIDNC
jgi:hypothetical protein